jgi:hypothetical protein
LYKIIYICWTRYPHLIPKLDALLSGSLQYVFKNLFFSSNSQNDLHHFWVGKSNTYFFLYFQEHHLADFFVIPV